LVVGGEFSERQPLGPIFLQVRNVGAQVLFHSCIHPFGLPIGLRMEGSAEAAVDSESVAKAFPECRSELWATVGDDAVREAMETEDML
jgi:hypothetical protein